MGQRLLLFNSPAAYGWLHLSYQADTAASAGRAELRGIRIFMEIASSLQPEKQGMIMEQLDCSVKQPEMMFTLIYLVLAALNHATQPILLFFLRNQPLTQATRILLGVAGGGKREEI